MAYDSFHEAISGRCALSAPRCQPHDRLPRHPKIESHGRWWGRRRQRGRSFEHTEEEERRVHDRARGKNGGGKTLSAFAEFYQVTNVAEQQAVDAYVKQTVDYEKHASIPLGHCAMDDGPAGDPPGLPLPTDVGATPAEVRTDPGMMTLLGLTKAGTDNRYAASPIDGSQLVGIRTWFSARIGIEGIGLGLTNELALKNDGGGIRLNEGAPTEIPLGFLRLTQVAVEIRFGLQLVCHPEPVEGTENVRISAADAQTIKNTYGANGPAEIRTIRHETSDATFDTTVRNWSFESLFTSSIAATYYF